MNKKRISAIACFVLYIVATFSSCVFLPDSASGSQSDSSVSSNETSSFEDSSIDESSSSDSSSNVDIVRYNVTFVCDDKRQLGEEPSNTLTIRSESPLTDAPVVADKDIIGWTTSSEIDYNTVDFPLDLTEDATLYAVRQTDFENYFPVIRIDTNNVAPSDTDEYTPASITVENTDEAFAFEDVSAGIRLRGNSTRGFDKKPYRIKFDKKQSMFGETKHKSWVLLAMYLDPSLIRDYFAHTLAQNFDNLEFASCAYHVELYLNGTYQGVYLLCDQMQEQKNSRIPIEIEEDELAAMTEVPFLIEKNQTRAEGESEYPYDWFEFNGNQYSIKYPENPTKEQYDYIVGYYTTAEQAVKDGDYDAVAELVDLGSVYDWFLINELTYNFDAVQLSGYIYKSVDGKMKFGPVWDFDNSFMPTYTGLVATTRDYSLATKTLFTTKSFRTTWMEYMFQNEQFKTEYCARWTEVRPVVVETFKHIKKYRVALRPTATKNAELWYQNLTLDDGSDTLYTPSNQNIFEDQYDFIETFLTERIPFLTLSYLPYSV